MKDTTEGRADTLPPIQLITVSTGGTSSWPRAEIYADEAREDAELRD